MTATQYALFTGTYPGTLYEIVSGADVDTNPVLPLDSAAPPTYPNTGKAFTMVMTQSPPVNSNGQDDVTGTITASGWCSDSVEPCQRFGLVTGKVTGEPYRSQFMGRQSIRQ